MKAVRLPLKERMRSIMTPFGPLMVQCTPSVRSAYSLSEREAADVDVWMASSCYVCVCDSNLPALLAGKECVNAL